VEFSKKHTMNRKINNALVSVYYKDHLDKIISLLEKLDIGIYSTGGTYDHIVRNGTEAHTVESLTSYPSILGGRVKTLHPKVFGGILGRRNHEEDIRQMQEYSIPEFDLVIVDLYPFESTVASGAPENEIIEKIDIGGISLIRAAAKNFSDVLVVPSSRYYHELIKILEEGQGYTTLKQRKYFATRAFEVSSAYDTAIFQYFNREQHLPAFRYASSEEITLRYGENPHQRGLFYGKTEEVFEQLHGKEISYNNLVDIDAGIQLIAEFDPVCFAILKHTNPCGLACRNNVKDAYLAALEADPLSAFGGVLICNGNIDLPAAEEINKLFFEVILANNYENDALDLLKSKKNRIILKKNSFSFPRKQFKSLLNGVLMQDKDEIPLTLDEMETVTVKQPEPAVKEDLLFANKVVKHTKSNAIVLARNKQLIAGGVGQTSRVDAVKQAIEKAHTFGLDLQGAVMASDAFFPFSDSVELAHKAGINAVIQPGGSVRDQESIDYCNQNGLSMVFTGKRHFKH